MKPRTFVTARRVIEQLTGEMDPSKREREIANFRVVIRAVQADYLRLITAKEVPGVSSFAASA